MMRGCGWIKKELERQRKEAEVEKERKEAEKQREMEEN